MVKKYFTVIFFSVILKSTLFGQYEHINVFPERNGEELLEALVKEYKTSVVLDYSIARDTLFSKIDGVQDSLECIYTGMKLYMKPGEDPTNTVFLNGQPNGINTEHVWPQGLGSTGIAQSDMHHLYPTRVKVNNDRANFLFGEIPDNLTQTWYYKSNEISVIPAFQRDLYSEGIKGINGKFEPRESVKGNIARSVFYFYTMYKSQADAAAPNYFLSLKNDLCLWHYNDPVDQVEWERNQKIAKYQGDKLNPFVLDCSLVSRAYCDNIDQACENLISNTTTLNGQKGHVKLFPNPGNGAIWIEIESDLASKFSITIKTINGHAVSSNFYELHSGKNILEFDLASLVNGVYMIFIADERGMNIANLPYVLIN